MKYLAILLHIYQPPTQLGFVVDEIARDCYQPLADIFLSDREPRFTLNINYSLTEQLVNRGHQRVIDDLRSAAESGRLEFVDSGAYHPIFPLLPHDEVERQLQVNREGNRKVFGASYAPGGVFPPEMCYSGHLARLFKNMGYDWCITDDLPYSHVSGTPPYNDIAQVDGLGVFLRSNSWSNDISFHSWHGRKFVAEAKQRLHKWFGDQDGYLIIAMDGETFGHHHKHYEDKFLRELVYAIHHDPEIKLVTVGELFKLFPMRERFIPPSTWSATPQDIDSDDPYPLWHSNFNPVHHNQWVLTHHVLDVGRRAAAQDPEVRHLLDRALYSCQYWWASAFRFDATQIYRGAYLLLDTLERAAQVLHDRDALRIGRDHYNNLVYSIADRNRQK